MIGRRGIRGDLARSLCRTAPSSSRSRSQYDASAKACKDDTFVTQTFALQDAVPKEVVKKKGPFLIPIADPLADEKMTKKVLKLAKKASKRKQTKRGTKEVVKGIRKGLKG